LIHWQASISLSTLANMPALEGHLKSLSTAAPVNDEPQNRIFLWTAPRCISTAFERSVMEVGGGKLFHEPYTSSYYFGPERISRRYEDQEPDMNESYRAVTERLTASFPDKDHVFVKDMAYAVHGRWGPLGRSPDSPVVRRCGPTTKVPRPENVLASVPHGAAPTYYVDEDHASNIQQTGNVLAPVSRAVSAEPFATLTPPAKCLIRQPPQPGYITAAYAGRPYHCDSISIYIAFFTTEDSQVSASTCGMLTQYIACGLAATIGVRTIPGYVHIAAILSATAVIAAAALFSDRADIATQKLFLQRSSGSSSAFRCRVKQSAASLAVLDSHRFEPPQQLTQIMIAGEL